MASTPQRPERTRVYRELLFKLNGELSVELAKAKRRMAAQQELLLRRAALLVMWRRARRIISGFQRTDVEIATAIQAAKKIKDDFRKL
ncbi:hypothetical protein EN873_04700 [bacterium M00.F.Ca.ET.230.01.1.1]|nr:hypothetical protein EN873_04700 [bacterium M00.F.Ca.ET.230.01.1.1]